MGRQLVPSSMVYDTPLDMTAEDAFSLLTRPRKNLLINGDFSIWQRASTQAAAGYGSADRWAMGLVGGTGELTKGAVTPGAHDFIADLDGTPISAPMLTFSGQSAANHCGYLVQRIENVAKVSNRQVTVSFTCLFSSVPYVAIELIQVFGNTGSPSPLVLIPAQKVAVSAGSRIKATFDIPSLSGKTITENSYLQLVLWMTAGSDFTARVDGLGLQSGTIVFTDVQVEVGPTATRFERRHIAEELALCQRYYERSYSGSTLYYIFSMYATTVTELQRIPFCIQKRAVPSVTATFTPHLAPGTMGTLYNMRADRDSFQPTYNWTSAIAGYAGHGQLVWVADAEL